MISLINSQWWTRKADVLIEQVEALFAVKNNGAMISIWVIAACRHQLRSDEIVLIVLSYRMTNDKNKRHKQVWSLFVKYVQNRQLIQLWEVCIFFKTCTIPYACPASHLLPSHQSHFPNTFTLSPTALHTPKPSLDAFSLTVRSTHKQPASPTQLSSMASSGKCITSTGRSA